MRVTSYELFLGITLLLTGSGAPLPALAPVQSAPSTHHVAAPLAIRYRQQISERLSLGFVEPCDKACRRETPCWTSTPRLADSSPIAADSPLRSTRLQL